MKILVIGFAKLKYMPYANFYLENVDKKSNEIHFLYWNRDQRAEDIGRYSGVILHEFKREQRDQVNKCSKLINFARFRIFAKGIIKSENIDFIIVMQSTCAVIMSTILIKKFSGRYIFDYRDSSYENHSWYKSIILKLEKNSKYTFVSSDGFRTYFPEEDQGKIITTHNILLDSLKHRDERKLRYVESKRIRISFWGIVRDLEINLKMIDRIGCDERFELHYYGKEETVANNLKQHTAVCGYNNIFFHGEYSAEDRYEFVRSTDLIHNTYDNNNNNMRIAMGNKFYDGLIFRIPQIINTGGYIMGEKATEYGVGLEVCPDDDAYCDKIYEYFYSINEYEFNQNCDKALMMILAEYDRGCQLVSSVVDFESGLGKER